MPIVVLAQAEAPPPATEETGAAERHMPPTRHTRQAKNTPAASWTSSPGSSTSRSWSARLSTSLRSPFATYLNDRSTQIRSDLVNAAEMKQTAAAQIEEIDRKMAALPGELEALRAQGAQEIAAEQARIRAAAAAERDRLLEQARRDIDQQVKIAERELVSHAADLAVGLAGERIKKTITDDDQKRLADRYVQQLKH